MCAKLSDFKEYSRTLKLIVIGHTSVGKTSVISSFCENSFNADVLHTVGVDYQSKVVKRNEDSIKLQIWDTAGQERFRTLTQGFYRGAAGILVIFDITNMKSFDQIPFWVESIHENCPNPPVVFLIGNKIDLESSREVSFDAADRTAQQYGFKYIECSAKVRININDIFTYLVEEIIEKSCVDVKDDVQDNYVRLTLNAVKSKQKKTCCD